MNFRKSSSEKLNSSGSHKMNSKESIISRINSYAETIFGRIFYCVATGETQWKQFFKSR